MPYGRAECRRVHRKTGGDSPPDRRERRASRMELHRLHGRITSPESGST
jgi:hypothetical protein